MTYKQAIEAGYRETHQAWTQGYVSRKNFNIQDAPVYEAGGRHKGKLFVLVPSNRSSQYCVRQYLKK